MIYQLADISIITVQKQVIDSLATRLNVLRHVHDAMAESQEKQKDQADDKGRDCIEIYAVVDQAFLDAKNLPKSVVSAVFKMKMFPRLI